MPFRLLARVRLNLRRMRGVVFGLGMAWSAYLLAAASDPLLLCGDGTMALAWFILTHPVVLLDPFFDILDLPLDEPRVQLKAFALATTWWFVAALIFRRRRARVLSAV